MKYHFEHKYIQGDFDNGHVTFENKEGDVEKVAGDLFVGCDGAYSAVRRNLMRKVRMDYSQVQSFAMYFSCFY